MAKVRKCHRKQRNCQRDNKRQSQRWIYSRYRRGSRLSPGSLVDVRPLRDTVHLEGKPLEFKVIEIDQKRNNVVVSRRACSRMKIVKKENIIGINGGRSKYPWHSENLTDYGAFVDLGEDGFCTLQICPGTYQAP